MGGLLKGKKVLVTGVLDRRSIAFSVARLASEQGAELALSSFGKAVNLTARTARRLDPEPPILELDVNKPEDIAAVAEDLEVRWGKLDGVVHAIAFAPEDALGGNFLTTEWPSVATASQTSWAPVPRSSVSTSTPGSPGLPTTGWAWRRPRWSPPPATWPGTWDRG